MTEYLLDDDSEMTQWVVPDEKGFTVRTRYKSTPGVLDLNQDLRNSAPSTFREDGVDFHLGARIPIEVVDQLHIRLGRAPTALELLALANDRDYCKLKTRNGRL